MQTWGISAGARFASPGLRSCCLRLLLNYLGQGAMLLSHPDRASSPFYLMAPSWAIYPLVALATMAAVIASQALISGVFSLTRQAVQLGYCPRLDIDHTSVTERGQIYIPQVNWMLMIATVALGDWLRQLERLGRCLWHCGDIDDGDHHAPGVSGGARVVGRQSSRRWLVRRVLSGHRARVLRREPHQDRARRVVPARGRRPALHRSFDVEEGPLAARLSHRRTAPSVERISSPDGRDAAVSRPRHRDLHDQQCGGNAADTPPQPRAQQGRPRARRSA